MVVGNLLKNKKTSSLMHLCLLFWFAAKSSFVDSPTVIIRTAKGQDSENELIKMVPHWLSYDQERPPELSDSN